MKGRLTLTFILLHVFYILSAQVYHYKTGKVIPSDEPGLYNFKEGVFNSYPAEYSILLAKENRFKKHTKLISIPIIRIKSTNNDSCSYPIFLLYGGPGESNLKTDLVNDDLLEYHDIIIIGYRGVDGSVKLDCPQIKKAILSESLSLDNSHEVFANTLNSCISSLKEQGIDVNGYSIDAVIEDVNDVRRELGYNKISFLAFSYGTIVAQQFAQKHCNLTENMLLIGARPLNNMTIDGEIFESQLYKFHKYYSLQVMGVKPFAKEVILKDFYKRVNGFSASNFNSTRFFIFAFSQLYTLNKLEDFFTAVYRSSMGDTSNLYSYYKAFYNNYPGDILLGDIYLKKQKQIISNPLNNKQKETIGNIFATQLNNWYSPKHPFFETIDNINIDTLPNTKILFISGELDVASPPQLLLKNKPYYPQSSYIELERTGHLDFFFDKKELVNSLIMEFYTSTTPKQ